jgi:predicted PurR-regulated permease PerM
VVALDDRAGNILTTIAVFAAVVAVAFVARATLVVFVLALLLAYLLEPVVDGVVAGVEHLLPRVSHARGTAIAVVYMIGTLLVAAAGYAFAPGLADQIRRVDAALPGLAARISRMSAAGHGDFVAAAVARASQAVPAAAEDIGWLLMVPIVAIFFLENRTAFLDGAVDLFARRGDRAAARGTIQQIDRVLAEYTRAQLILAGLSGIFYGVSMAVLGFPYPLALGVAGGALEFVPVIGWMVATAAILASGWLAHAHWIWMAALIPGWRIIQNFVNSPRVIGDRLQMEPITVLLALMVGGQLGGLVGVILSVPAVAVFRIVRQQRASSDTALPVASLKP